MKTDNASSRKMVDGVCCAYCAYFETPSCPVSEASPWSRWLNWCNEYTPNTAMADAKPLLVFDNQMPEVKNDSTITAVSGLVCEVMIRFNPETEKFEWVPTKGETR